MKVVVISAHYPPNFVSGGTLVPQRLARGVRDHGHDVSVFAGWLGERESLSEFDEIDETGLRVHWIATSAWIGWDDRRNFDNPAVVQRFAVYLEHERPDIVHLHSLQAMGGAMVSAAKASGARVVLTMHDFWWICARQFLVDETDHPCSLVAVCGSCACSTSTHESAERRSWLLEHLRCADLILAPSQSAAAVLRANGLGNVEVDENGIQDPGALTGRLAGADPIVRVRYCGGSNSMKGAEVIGATVPRITAAAPWTFTAHDFDDYLIAHPNHSHPRLHTAPSYRPDQLTDILAATDILVLPSLMRESHSLLTREALLAGVPVVCSDSLGPEEVVIHGENGYVVPTGDSELLATAVTRLIDDPILRRSMGTTARKVVVRSLNAHITSTVDRYEGLLLADTSPPPRSQVRQVLFVCGIEGAPLRYRAHLPAEALNLVGIHTDVVHYQDPRVLGLALDSDVVVMYRVPATTEILEILDQIRNLSPAVPLLFDVDDLIFDPAIADEIPAMQQLASEESALWLNGVMRYRTTLEACDAFIGSTPELCRHAETVSHIPSFHFDNGVGILLAQASTQALRQVRAPGPLRVGYFSGTTTHDDDWLSIEPSVINVLRRYDQVELWLGGHLKPSAGLEEFGERVRRLPFTPWPELVIRLRDLDVNLAPLTLDGRFNQSKSAIKWLEAALVETPTIASPTEPFVAAIQSGRSGILATTPAEWERGLDNLLSDSLLRARIGGQARRSALLEWSPLLQASRYLAVLDEACDLVTTWRTTRVASTWIPVAPSEPGTYILKDVYTASLSDLPPRSPVGRVRPRISRRKRVIDGLNAAMPNNAATRAFRSFARRARSLVRRSD